MTTDIPALRKRLAEFMDKVWPYDYPFPWRPDEDISQAMMVASRIGEVDEDCIIVLRILGKNWGEAALASVDYIYMGTPLEWFSGKPALAISLAADAWLRQGGRT